jgi:protease IV
MVRSSRLRFAFLGPVLTVLAFGASEPARAQLHRSSDPVATPASSLVLQDDALALDVNPAALGRLPAWSLALLHSEIDAAGSWLGRGDALYFSTPVFGPLSIGLTLQSVRPDVNAPRPLGDPEADRAIAALAFSFAAGAPLSVGLTARTFASGNAQFDGLTSIDAGLQLRPSNWLSVGLVGRDLFLSREGFGTGGLDLGSTAQLSAGLRPFGSDTFTFDFTMVGDPADLERLGGRAGVVIEVPYVGALTGMVEADDLGDVDSALRVVAELAVSGEGLTAVGGGMGGDGFDGKLGWYAMLRAEGHPRPGLPLSARVLDLEISGLSARSMLGISLALERARIDPRIAGVLLRPRGSSMPLAYAQELRLQIQALRAAGKPVVCHLDSASGADFYACSAANRSLLDPAGDVRLMGSSSTVMLFGETLKKIGVRADFVRIGAYKSAPEQYTQSQLSEEARAQTRGLLDDVHRRMLADLAHDMKVPESKVAEIIDEGPHLAYSAKAQGLVADTVDEHELQDGALDVFDGKPLTRSLPADTARPWGMRPSIGVLLIDDQIVDGESVDVPFIGIHMSGGETLVRELDAMAGDPNIRAIVLRVDSPGGAALASDKIWRAVRRARARKPVVASMGAVAASGGYYVACAADEIWADPSTLTGSIGIFYGKVDVVGLAGMLGVGIENFARGKRAGADSIFRPFTEEERAALADAMRTYYRLFLARVAEGRGMKVEAVDALGRGRVYSGDRAQQVGLVDRLGGFASALMRARELAGLGSDAPVDVRPPRRDGLLDFLLGSVVGGGQLAAGSASDDAPLRALPKGARTLLRIVTTLEQIGSGAPLALMPYQIEM